MIERGDVLSIPYLKKAAFSGSYQGMRFLMKLRKGEEKNSLLVFCWEEPYSFDKTPEEDKVTKEFEFSEAGIQQAVDWLNRSWKEREESFREAKEHWDRNKKKEV